MMIGLGEKSMHHYNQKRTITGLNIRPQVNKPAGPLPNNDAPTVEGHPTMENMMEGIPNDSPAPVDPMVYRDLLIFEESLRSQYLYLQKRRRKYLGTKRHAA
jgi:hypothetical protein